MTPANYKPFSIEDIPDCKGKQVYLKIMNSPKFDEERIRKQVEEYINTLSPEQEDELSWIL